MNRLFSLITLLTVLCTGHTAYAQETMPLLRSVTSSYTFETGAAHIADTYLTPLHYRGTHFGLQYERDQAMKFAPTRWTMQLKLGTVFDHTENPAKNASMVNASFQAAWAMMRRFNTPAGITLGVGPGISLDAGVLYLSRNGNNPASAKAALMLDVTGYALYSGKVWKVPFTLRYQPTLSLTGMFFAPDYGELYYQIYLGKDDGLIHAAWPGSYFNLDNLVTADLHFGATSLRIGYHNRTFSSKTNDTVTRDITHAIVLGITTEWISLRPSDKAVKAKIISSY